jgi:hypothetical protein
VMEYWSGGVMGSDPITPLLHHSNSLSLILALARVN